jgi:hypothetical protein
LGFEDQNRAEIYQKAVDLNFHIESMKIQVENNETLMQKETANNFEQLNDQFSKTFNQLQEIEGNFQKMNSIFLENQSKIENLLYEINKNPRKFQKFVQYF